MFNYNILSIIPHWDLGTVETREVVSDRSSAQTKKKKDILTFEANHQDSNWWIA